MGTLVFFMRFSIRDVMWLTLAMGLAVAWLVDRNAADRRFNDLKNQTIVTPQFLEENGFTEGNTAGIYQLGPLPVGEIADRLGFRMREMIPTANQKHDQDSRIVRLRNLYFVVDSVETDANGRVYSRLPEPTAIARCD